MQCVVIAMFSPTPSQAPQRLVLIAPGHRSTRFHTEGAHLLLEVRLRALRSAQ